MITNDQKVFSVSARSFMFRRRSLMLGSVRDNRNNHRRDKSSRARKKRAARSTPNALEGEIERASGTRNVMQLYQMRAFFRASLTYLFGKSK